MLGYQVSSDNMKNELHTLRTVPHNPMWDKVISIVIYILILGALAYYTAFFLERNPLVYPNIPFPTDMSVYLPGEDVNVDIQRCVDYPLTYAFSARLVGVSKESQDQRLTLAGGSISVPVPDNAHTPYCESLSALRQGIPQNDINGRELVAGDYVIEYDIFNIEGRFRKHKMSARTRVFRIEQTVKDKETFIEKFNAQEKLKQQEQKLQQQMQDAEKGSDLLRFNHQGQSQSIQIPPNSSQSGSQNTPQPTGGVFIPLPTPIIPLLPTLPLPTLRLLNL